MHTSNPAFARHIPGIEVPEDLADLYALHNEMFGGVKMMADEAPENQGGDNQPDSAQQGEGGKPDDFKSEHSKQAVLADLSKERTARQALEAEVEKLKPLADQFAKIAAAFGGDDDKGDKDTTGDQLAAIQKRLDEADAKAEVERLARKHKIESDDDVALLASITDAKQREALAARLAPSENDQANGRRIPKPDPSRGAGGGDGRPRSVAEAQKEALERRNPKKTN